MPLFTQEGHALVAAGKLTISYRLWKTPKVREGKTYATGFGGAYHIRKVTQVRAGDVTRAQARAAGCDSVEALWELVGHHTRTTVKPDMILTRLELSFVEEAPQKETLSVEDALAGLARLDKASKRGPWTEAALRLIEQNPRVLAATLAREFGMPKLDFKVDIRKLKKLGLTISHPIGYELSELGLEVLDHLGRKRGR